MLFIQSYANNYLLGHHYTKITQITQIRQRPPTNNGGTKTTFREHSKITGVKFIMVLKEAPSRLHGYVILTTSICKITWNHIIEISTCAKDANSTGTLHRHQR
jgi:hypothetical protein